MLIEHFGDTSEITSKPCCDFHIRVARGEPHPDIHGSIVARPAADTGGAKADTVAETGKLFADGLSLREVAAQRGLTPSTIYHHAAQLIGAGALGLRTLVTESQEILIRAAIAKVGSTERLAPVKAELPDAIDYGAIRCVVAQLARENPPANADPTPDAAG